jgi:hypothetical protein
MTIQPKYLRAGEVARLLGMSERTVRRWIANKITQDPEKCGDESDI